MSAYITSLIQTKLGPCVLIPVPFGQKGPRIKAWQTKTLADMQDPAYLEQFQPPVNIGVLLGEPSDGLISIDLDVADAYREFIKWNPGLEQAFQSAARRGRNLWIRIEGEYPRTFVLSTCDGNGKKTPIGEFRSTGSQTIVFGKHPSGVYYKWLKHSEALRLRYDQIIWPPGWIRPESRGQPTANTGHVQTKLKKEEPAKPNPEANSDREKFVLPGDLEEIPRSAGQLFGRIGPTHTLFLQDRDVVEVVDGPDSRKVLKKVDVHSFRSRIQEFVQCYARVEVSPGQFADFSAMPTADQAKVLMASSAAKHFLPAIRVIVNGPVLVSDSDQARVLGQGFDAETGVLVLGGGEVPDVPLDQAVARVGGLFGEWDVQTPADKSRMIAALITPALRLGKHIRYRVPMFVVEADQSQAGKNYLAEVIAAVYGENLNLVTQRRTGVGSGEEGFDKALLEGRPFVVFDNWRGRLDSTHLESFLTATGSFPTRIAYRRGIAVDPSAYTIWLTSNGAELTTDLSNRAVVIRIRKKNAYQFRNYAEGDLLTHVQANRLFYIGCVFAVVIAWLQKGKAKTGELRHAFREWTQSLDWIIGSLFGLPPLMEGHEMAQQRTANSALSFVRAVAICVARRGQLGIPLRATGIFEMVTTERIPIPGLGRIEPEAGRKRIGGILAEAFGNERSLEVEGYACSRSEEQVARDDGKGNYVIWEYIFSRADGGRASRTHTDGGMMLPQ